MTYLLLVFIFFTTIKLSEAQEYLCPELIIHTDEEIQLSDTELRMICGDPKVQAYQKIPPYQAQIFMTGFLQSRGYLLPEYKITNGVLHVHPGGVSRIEIITISTGEEEERKYLNREIHRQFRDKVLNPGTLDNIESDGLSLVRRRGFPCAKIDTEANALDGSVTLKYEHLKFFNFGDVVEEEIEDLDQNALKRFYPFTADDPFNEMLLNLTEKRMLRSEVVSGTYFLERCSLDGQKFSLYQHFILGPPRSIRYGVGANTEMGPMARVRWSNNRF
jgi:hypothetical protein